MYVRKSYNKSFVLKHVGLSKSTYYYRNSNNKRGRKTSIYTEKLNGNIVSNSEVVNEIENLLLNDFVTYGYIKMTYYLKQKGYVINKKKVYRLMKENNLLLQKRIKPTFKRDLVKERKVSPKCPYEMLEIDIKYIYIKAESRNVYLLTLIDVYSRKVLGYVVKPSIRKNDVINLFDRTLPVKGIITGITVRNDNGSQFIANDVRNYLKERDIYQEFTHVSSPKENAHIEAFHSILEREFVRRIDYETFDELEQILRKYYKFYNEDRIHSGIDYLSPDKYMKMYFDKKN
jgi:transposase InsO family protein